MFDAELSVRGDLVVLALADQPSYEFRC